MSGEIEDVDTGDMTPWEQETVAMALAALRRHGFHVTVTRPEAAPVPPWGGLLVIGDAEAPDALFLSCPCPAHAAAAAGLL